MTRHADAETLARYRQEDLSRRRASRIRAHLGRCARCRALDEDLAGVTVLLADVQPPPIPEHLAARIQTALAAEAARRVVLPAQTTSTAPAAAEAPQSRTEPAGTGRPGRRTSRHGRHGRDRIRRRPGFTSPLALRTMAAAAAVVVLAGGGYEIAQHVGGSSSTASSPTAGSNVPLARPPASGSIGSSGLAAGANGQTLQYQHDGQQASVTPVTSGTDFTPANLRSQVSRDLARSAAGTAPRPMHRASPAQQAGTFGGIPVQTLQGCVNRVAAGQMVLLVDVARYQGRPATVIVTRVSADGPEQVWVVGRGCSGGNSDLLTHATLAPAG